MHDAAISQLRITHRFALIRQVDTNLGSAVTTENIGWEGELVLSIERFQKSLPLLPLVQNLHVCLR